MILIKYIDQIFKGIDSMTEHGFFPREGQEDLMLDIGEAIEGGYPLIAEAGVGIGKSFAYLIPGLLRSWPTGKPLIVSSSSIQLTEQLVADVQEVSQILSKNFTYEVGKGKTNYVCYKRYESSPRKEEDRHTSIGELQAAWDDERVTQSQRRLWCVERCAFKQCEHRHACDFYNMRQRLGGRGTASVDCLIVNHNLLVEDLRQKKLYGKKGLIEEGHTIVIDEAHKFEDVVRDAMNIKLDHRMVKRMSRLIENLRLSRFDITSLETALGGFLDSVNTFLRKEHIYEADYILDNRLDFKSVVLSHREAIKSIVEQLDTLHNDLLYFDYDETKETLYEELTSLVDTFREYLDGIIRDESVYWAVYEREFSQKGLVMCSAPKNINEIIRKLLFNQKRSVILTSATLGTGNDPDDHHSYYSYQRKALGMPKQMSYSHPQPSPYDYVRNTRVYIPGRGIDVKSEESASSIALEIKRLADVFEGRTLVLFTSKKQLDQVSDILLELRGSSPWEILKQDGTKSVKGLQRDFAGGGAKVLLSTGSFWEGVNIKGDALSCLVVVRLPYPVPDPVIQHKATLIPSMIEDEMMIKMKQGTGRLIRSEDDMGVVAIFDERILQRPHILQSLPFGPVLQDIREVERFRSEEMTEFLSLTEDGVGVSS